MGKSLHSRWSVALTLGLLLAVGAGSLACNLFKKKASSSGGGSSSTPTLSNINGATSPSCAVGQPIEINGANFDASSVSVTFVQGSITATATPTGATDSSLVVTVPSGEGSNEFAVPGNLTVAVQSNGTTTSSATLPVTAAPYVDLSDATWAASTPLPVALTGLRAVAVPSTGTSAYIVVAGGSTGILNTAEVYSNNLNTDGTVGANWTGITANQLPSSVAHHGMVEADASNSPAPAGTSYIYIIGGQALLGGGPGGVSTVYMASVNTSTGVVGPWALLSNTLPQPLVGPAVTLFHGWIYVVGGLLADGSPSTAVYSAQVNANGSLGTWATSGNSYPLGISFATAFGYGGSLFVLNGDPVSSTDPNALGSAAGSNTVYYARVVSGSVGSWTQAAGTTLEARKKHNTWCTYGQVMNGEGIYPGAIEFEWSLINSTSVLGSWTALVNPPHANVYNAAAVVSPLLTSAGTPRLLFLGGQTVASGGEGPLSSTVYYNNSP